LLDASRSIVTRRIAIALFGDEVSPRFCFAEAVVVVDIAEGRTVGRQVVSLGEPWLARRLSQLASLGVHTLVCGAFNRAYLPAAERLGIQVITGVAGNKDEAIARFAKWRTGCCRRARLAEAPVSKADAGRSCRRRNGTGN
jgi:predicted Fe-Mo cluster-binding NifX family protein